MSLLLSLTLVVGQIQAGPPPEKEAELLRIGAMVSGMGSRSSKPFPIARYLQAAERLQAAPEAERVAWLRMAARSHELEEPAVLLSLLLIVPKEGKRFREFRDSNGWGGGTTGEGDDRTLFPFRMHKGIPFYVGSPHGGMMLGLPEHASTYVEYLLANGEWRETKYKSPSRDDLKKNAEEFVKEFSDGPDGKPGLGGVSGAEAAKRDILRQAAVPLEATEAETKAIESAWKMRPGAKLSGP